MRFLYWIEMLPSNRLGINDNEENEPSPGAFNITREAQHRPPITRAEPISAFSSKEEETRFEGRRIHVPLFAEARSIASNSVSLKRQPSASRLVLA